MAMKKNVKRSTKRPRVATSEVGANTITSYSKGQKRNYIPASGADPKSKG